MAGRKLIGTNRKKDGADKDYAGTLHYHRLAAYAHVIVETGWRIEGDIVVNNGIDLLNDPPRLAAIFDRIACLEAVKCSPPWKKSTPTPNMMRNCPSHFLDQELAILQPDVIIRLGKTTPSALRSTSTALHRQDSPPFSATRAAVDWGTMWEVVLPHPASFGGNKKLLVASFASFVSELRQAGLPFTRPASVVPRK